MLPAWWMRTFLNLYPLLQFCFDSLLAVCALGWDLGMRCREGRKLTCVRGIEGGGTDCSGR